MKVHFTLSSKTNEEGLNEILLMVQPRIKGIVYTMRAKSGIFIDASYFDKATGIKSLSRKHSDVHSIHRLKAEELHKLVAYIQSQYEALDKANFSSDWLKSIVDRYVHPEWFKEQEEAPKSFYELSEEYLSKKTFSVYHINNIRVMVRAVLRYEGFIRLTDKERKDFVFDINAVTREDVEDFRDYLRNEKELADEYPKVFAKLLKNYPACLMTNRNYIQAKGENAVIKLMKKLKAFFTWLNENDITKNRPFEGVKIGTEQAGTPIYITNDERNTIASAVLKGKDGKESKHLETQRDIFIFQCLIGCRVGDLMKLTPSHITGNMLTYTPHKTKNEGEHTFTARVPLIEEALRLIEKYRGVDKQGRLFPFISQQRYNDAIKVIFTQAGITRDVEVLNALTKEVEIKPINEVASSHMARKTFIGNLYLHVQDPNLIGQMSGHVEGSKAFKRYRKIEDSTLQDVIKNLEK